MAAVDIFFYIEPYPLTNLVVIRNKGLVSESIITPTDTGSSYEVESTEGTFTISADGYITTTETVHDGMGILTITLQPVKYISNLSDGTNTYVIKDAEAREAIDNLATVATSGSYNDLSNKPDLNGKADVDLNNTTDTGYIKMAGSSMPSSRYIDLTIGSNESTYTAPANGWFNFRGYGTSVEIYRDNMHVCCMYPQPEWGAVIMPVQKGQTITILYNLTGERNLRFYYSQGSESEAN